MRTDSTNRGLRQPVTFTIVLSASLWQVTRLENSDAIDPLKVGVVGRQKGDAVFAHTGNNQGVVGKQSRCLPLGLGTSKNAIAYGNEEQVEAQQSD